AEMRSPVPACSRSGSSETLFHRQHGGQFDTEDFPTASHGFLQFALKGRVKAFSQKIGHIAIYKERSSNAQSVTQVLEKQIPGLVECGAAIDRDYLLAIGEPNFDQGGIRTCGRIDAVDFPLQRSWQRRADRGMPALQKCRSGIRQQIAVEIDLLDCFPIRAGIAIQADESDLDFRRRSFTGVARIRFARAIVVFPVVAKLTLAFGADQRHSLPELLLRQY